MLYVSRTPSLLFEQSRSIDRLASLPRINHWPGFDLDGVTALAAESAEVPDMI